MIPPQANNTNTASLPDFDAVLWDMDGTLVDSEPLHELSIRLIGDQIGFPVSKDLADRSLGVGHQYCYDMLTKELGMTIDFPAWMAMVEKAYLDATAHVEPRETAVDIVKALHARGIKQAIFSNSPRNILDANVKGFLRFFDQKDGVFSQVISVNDVMERKPSPEGYVLAAHRLGVAPEKCLVIEDSPTGVKAGKAAGCFTIFWPQNPSLQSEIAPDLKVEDLRSLLA